MSDTREGAEAPSGMLCNAIHDGEAFHFSMCNPPFFESLKEAGRNPNTACGGTAAEMVCKGGELAFLKAMVDERHVARRHLLCADDVHSGKGHLRLTLDCSRSLKLRGLVHWFTSMLGKKLTMKEIRKHLHSLKVPVIRSTQFFQVQALGWHDTSSSHPDHLRWHLFLQHKQPSALILGGKRMCPSPAGSGAFHLTDTISVPISLLFCTKGRNVAMGDCVVFLRGP